MPYMWFVKKLRIYQWVENVDGTKNDKPPRKIGSWKQLWMNETGWRWPARCSRMYCGSRPEVGAHVYTLRNGKCYSNTEYCTINNKRQKAHKLNLHLTLL